MLIKIKARIYAAPAFEGLIPRALTLTKVLFLFTYFKVKNVLNMLN